MSYIMHASENENWGCDAGIMLDSRDAVVVSIVRGELFVRQHRESLWKTLAQSVTGRGLHISHDTYKNAKMAKVLDAMFPQRVPGLSAKNPVLSAFANAIWHCPSVREVEMLFRSCEPPPDEASTSPWRSTDEYAFYALALQPNWRETFIEGGYALYTVVWADDKKDKKLLRKEVVSAWAKEVNEGLAADNKPYRIMRLETSDGVTVWKEQAK
jgi:hypothetical protein